MPNFPGRTGEKSWGCGLQLSVPHAACSSWAHGRHHSMERTQGWEQNPREEQSFIAQRKAGHIGWF